jgi:hypothetical protein
LAYALHRCGLEPFEKLGTPNVFVVVRPLRKTMILVKLQGQIKEADIQDGTYHLQQYGRTLEKTLSASRQNLDQANNGPINTATRNVTGVSKRRHQTL